jgi:hypothetical protein
MQYASFSFLRRIRGGGKKMRKSGELHLGSGAVSEPPGMPGGAGWLLLFQRLHELAVTFQ